MARNQRRSEIALRLDRLEPRELLSSTMMGTIQPNTPELRDNNSLIVRFDDSVAPQRRAEAAAAAGGSIAITSPGGADFLVFGDGSDLDAAAARLALQPGVRYAERNRTLSILAAPNDPSYESLWGLGGSSAGSARANAAWDVTTGSATVTVAVTDTGVDYDHPDLYLNIAVDQAELPAAQKARVRDTNADGLIDFYDFNSLDASRNVTYGTGGSPINAGLVADSNADGRISGSDLLADPRWADGLDQDADGLPDDLVGEKFINSIASSRPKDDHWHGTHVSGTIGAIGNNGVGVVGVNWNVRILPVKFLDSTGNGTLADAIASIEYAADQGVRIINASWGDPGTSSALQDAVAYAGSKGSIFVAAAGNNAANNDTTPFTPADIRLPNVVSVAAITSAGALAGFSNWGPQTVDLAAPGDSILSTTPNGGYGWASGTSMAAPHVSGALALLAFRRPDLSANELVARLKQTARPSSRLVDRLLTSGQLDIAAALALPGYPAPASLSASPSGRNISLSWAAANGASGYVVERSNDGKTGWARAGATAGATSFVDPWITSGTTYYYRVRSTGVSGDSMPSPVASATVSRPMSAVLVSTDTSTKGSWSGVYGSQGYTVAGGSASLPPWSPVSMSGQSSFTWAYPTTDARALQRSATDATRTASCWYSAGSFKVSVPLTDGAAHRVSLYMLDWDSRGRKQRVEVLDAATGALLDTRDVSAFQGGVYLTWEATVSVVFRITSTGPVNAVLGGVFVDAAGQSIPTGLTAKGSSTTAVDLSWSAAAGATGYKVERSADGSTGWSQVGSTSGATTYRDAGLSAGTAYYYRVRAAGAAGDSIPSGIAAVETNPATAINFLGSDASTGGGWVGAYGSEGYRISGGGLSIPSFASLSLSGQSDTIWAASTSDPRALRASPAVDSRVASAWSSSTNFTANLSLTDGETHRVSLYLVDWETAGNRKQRVEVLDAATGAVLDTRDLASFQGGIYLSWQVTGSVRFRLTSQSSGAVLGGVFLDAAGLASPTGLTAKGSSTTAVDLSWSAAAGATGYKVERSADGSTGWSQVGSTSGATTYRDAGLSAGTAYYYRVRAAGAAGDSIPSAVASATTLASGTGAVLVSTDTSTKGSWSGVYGSQGYTVAGGSTSLPPWSPVSMSGQSSFTWVSTTTDARALQRSATDATRTAATWYSASSFTLNVPIKDAATHRVSLYMVDWDSRGRKQRVEVLDASTGALLDTRDLSSYQGGVYLTWQVTVPVVFRITSTGPVNAVLSGVFFD